MTKVLLAAALILSPQLAQPVAAAPSDAVALDLAVTAPDYSWITDYNIVHLVWQMHGVDDLATHIKIDCVIQYESKWNRYARSRTGDSGLFQINDIHWLRWQWVDGSLDIFDPWVNAEVAWQLWSEAGGRFSAWSPPARYC